VTPALARAVEQLRAGNPAGAIAPLREEAARDPSNPTILHDLGLAYLETGAWREAAAAFRGAIDANPRYTDAHFRLGLALERSGDPRGAVVAYDRATELLPSLTEAWYRTGALVFSLGHRDEAIGCFRRAASTGRKSSFGRLGEARALLAEDRDPEAERVLRQLLARDAGNAMAHDLLGNILADAGRFEEARACFARAIENGPLMAGSYYDLVRCRRTTPDDAGLIGAMQASLALPGLQIEQRIRVHLAIGKASDDLGEHENAMRHFDAADVERRTLMPFDPGEFERQVDRLIERFSADLFARPPAAGSPDATPILIVGLPRSGTTLTEQILSCHPDVAGCGELNFWNERGIAWVRSGMTGPEAKRLSQDAADYLALLRATAPGSARRTDKMPFNVLWAGLAHLALPNAVIVHCSRDALDTALSIHQTHFNPRLAFPTGGEELVRYVRCTKRLTDHWRRVLPADRFHVVDYDALTRTPEPVIRGLIAACGLTWDDRCLRPEDNPRAVKTPSRWQARQKINRDAVQRWRRYEPWLGPLAALKPEPDAKLTTTH
jgi:Flp pilus assembly protein TadD